MSGELRKLLSDLDGLARQQPAAADSAAAVQATHAALQARRPGRRHWLRVTIPSGIAACVLAAALLGWFIQSSSSARATEHFAQAVESARDYQGWIQLVATPQGAITVPGRGLLVSITCRSNAAEGLYGEVRAYQSDTDITFCSLRQKTLETYARSSGEIHRRTLSQDDDDDRPRDLLLPASVGDALARVKSTLGRDPASLRHSHDSGDLRIDVTLFASHEEENEFHRRNASATGTPARFSVWINAQNQMTRLACETLGGTLESQISYGVAPVTSIYDLGVPRDAPVVETRLKEHDRDD